MSTRLNDFNTGTTLTETKLEGEFDNLYDNKVDGPASGGSTDDAIPRYDGTGGITIKDSNVIIDDSDAITGITDLTATGNITGTFIGDITGNVTGNVNATTITIANVTVESFPSGTALVFYQSTAPTGWTKQSTSDDYFLRVVTGDTGGNASGSWGTLSHTHGYAHTHTLTHTHTGGTLIFKTFSHTYSNTVTIGGVTYKNGYISGFYSNGTAVTVLSSTSLKPVDQDGLNMPFMLIGQSSDFDCWTDSGQTSGTTATGNTSTSSTGNTSTVSAGTATHGSSQHQFVDVIIATKD